MFTKHNKTNQNIMFTVISLQNKQMFYKLVMFTKQKQNEKFRDKLCLQNKQKTKQLQTSYVYKTNKSLQNKSFTNTLCLQNKNKIKCTHNLFTNQKFTNTLTSCQMVQS